jgi:hypothetical protein
MANIERKIKHKITVACYLIKLHPPNDRENYLRLDSFNGQDDFLQFIGDFFKSLYSVNRNDEQQKTIRMSSDSYTLRSNERIVSGIIYSGEYGVEGSIIDAKTGELKYKRKKGEADERPFYFMLHFPEGKNEGIIILQRTGNLGVIDIMNYKLREAFRAKYPNIIMEFESLVTKELAKLFLNEGAIRQVILTKYIHPSDLADKVTAKDHKEEKITMEIRFKTTRSGKYDFRKQVNRFIKDKNSKIFSLKGLDQLGFGKDSHTSIQVVHNGNTRTMDLGDTAQIRPYYDIHSELKFDSSGHPNFDSIDKVVKKLLGDLLTDIYPIK